LDQHTIMKVLSTLSAVFMAKAGLAEPQIYEAGVLPMTGFNQLSAYTVRPQLSAYGVSPQVSTYTVSTPAYQPILTSDYGYQPVMTQVYDFDGRKSYPIQMRVVKREAEREPTFTYSIMAHHPSDAGMDQNRYDMFLMNNQMNRPISQQYRMNNMNQPMGQQYHQMDQYRFDTNQMNDQQKRMEMMMMNEQMNGQMDQRMNGRQSHQMNRPNRMFDQRINSVNQMDGQQRMQYRMNSNQMNQINQLDNRRFKRGADSDFVAYRTMTQTPFQRSHSEVVMQTEPIQLVQGSYGYSFPTVFQGPVNQGYSLYALRRPMVYL